MKHFSAIEWKLTASSLCDADHRRPPRILTMRFARARSLLLPIPFQSKSHEGWDQTSFRKCMTHAPKKKPPSAPGERKAKRLPLQSPRGPPNSCPTAGLQPRTLSAVRGGTLTAASTETVPHLAPSDQGRASASAPGSLVPSAPAPAVGTVDLLLQETQGCSSLEEGRSPGRWEAGDRAGRSRLEG